MGVLKNSQIFFKKLLTDCPSYVIIIPEGTRKEVKKMTKFRENLIDRMIKIYGYEHEIVLEFCRLCENWESNVWNDKCLEIVVEAHEAEPMIFEEV